MPQNKVIQIYINFKIQFQELIQIFSISQRAKYSKYTQHTHINTQQQQHHQYIN